jgi:hypothetical protein
MCVIECKVKFMLVGIDAFIQNDLKEEHVELLLVFNITLVLLKRYSLSNNVITRITQYLQLNTLKKESCLL